MYSGVSVNGIAYISYKKHMLFSQLNFLNLKLHSQYVLLDARCWCKDNRYW